MNIHKIENKILDWQKHLASIPELAWHESKTSQFIQRQLGNDFIWKGKNAIIYKVGRGIPIFFRAELDALNTIEGPRHVCGHNAHMAALMGAYISLKTNPPKDKTILFIFQPSEEDYPSGAKYISHNFPELKTCHAGFAFHAWASENSLELHDAPMAGCDYFEIEVKGKGTHIKNKNKINKTDCIAVAGEIAQIINNHRDEVMIINVGTIHGGETSNALATYVKMTGDVRAFNEQQKLKAKKFITNVVDTIQNKSKGVIIDLQYFNGYPAMKNDKKILLKLKKLIKIQTHNPSFGTEDFSFYPVPKIMLHIGTGSSTELHQTDFIVPKKVTLAIYDYWITIANYFDF